MSDTPTPRTDAYFAPLIANQGVLTRFVYTKDIDFARTLERENTQLRADLAKVREGRDAHTAELCKALEAYEEQVQRLETDLAKVREERDELKVEVGSVASKLGVEREYNATLTAELEQTKETSHRRDILLGKILHRAYETQSYKDKGHVCDNRQTVESIVQMTEAHLDNERAIDAARLAAKTEK